MEIKLAEGRVKRGHKIGLTSRAMQQASQIDEPDFGMLLDDMFFRTAPRFPPAASSCRAWRSSWPSCWASACKAERHAVPVYDAVDYVIPALEIIDARSHGIDPDSKRPRRSSTPSPTMPPTPAWCWAGDQ